MYFPRFKASLALASVALAGVGLVFTGEGAIAAEATVNLTGRVGSACTLDNAQAGVFDLHPDFDYWMDTRAHGGQSGAVAQGSAGTVDVDCSGAATIQITNSEITASPAGFALQPGSFFVSVRRANGESATWRDNGNDITPLVTTGAIDETLAVHSNFFMQGQATLPDGDYAATVTVTANPN